MHNCAPQGAFICTKCYSFWCFDCAYHKYVDTGENRFILHCAHCKKHFGIIEIEQLHAIRNWGLVFGKNRQNKTVTPIWSFGKNWPPYQKSNVKLDPKILTPTTYVRIRILWLSQKAHQRYFKTSKTGARLQSLPQKVQPRPFCILLFPIIKRRPRIHFKRGWLLNRGTGGPPSTKGYQQHRE